MDMTLVLLDIRFSHDGWCMHSRRRLPCRRTRSHSLGSSCNQVQFVSRYCLSQNGFLRLKLGYTMLPCTFWLAEISNFILSKTIRQMELYCSINDPSVVLYQSCVFGADPESKMAAISGHNLTYDPMRISFKVLLFWNHSANLNQT